MLRQRELAARARELAVRERRLTVKERELADQAQKVAAQERRLASGIARHARSALTDLLTSAADSGLTRTDTGTQTDKQRLVVAEAGRRIFTALAELKTTWCQTSTDNSGRTVHGRDGYRPAARQRAQLIQRDVRCMWPGCRRPAAHCDLDHSIPYHHQGATCTCNLMALCRRHHRLKTQPDWSLTQPWPGIALWISPTGHWYITGPDTHQ